MKRPFSEPVTWRGTTRFCAECQTIDVSFHRADGSVLRLRLDSESARHLAETLTEAAEAKDRSCCQPCLVQSASSSGNPMAEVSMTSPFDRAEKVALLSRSSSAESGE